MAVSCNEHNDSPKLSIGLDGGQATRHCRIAWGDIADFLNEYILPGILAGASGSAEPTSFFPGWPWMKVQSVSIEPFGGQQSKISGPNDSVDFSTVVQYEYADVTVNYSTIEGEVLPAADHQQLNPADPVILLEHSWSAGGEFVTMDAKDHFYWCSDNGKVGGDVQTGIVVPTIEHTVRWPRVFNPPFSVIRDTIGKVNVEQVSFTTGKIYPETLLFSGVELRRAVLSDGGRAWDLTYHFSEKTVPAADATEAILLVGPFGAIYFGTENMKFTYNGTRATLSEFLADSVFPSYNTPVRGGWNHFFRNDKDAGGDVRCGFYRAFAANLIGNGQRFLPYSLGDFSNLFYSEPTSGGT